MLERLTRNERLRLMKFVCSFAWADLEVRPQERQFIARLVERLELDEGDRATVQGWLEEPPSPEEVDPTEIPSEHRRIFVAAIEAMVAADREISPEERESLELLKALFAEIASSGAA